MEGKVCFWGGISTVYPEITGILFLFVFVFGSVIGSFLAVVAYRLPLGISFVQGRSFCPACGKQLRAWDLAPIISYLALGGRCRYCGGKIGLRSLAVELFTGLLAVALAAVYGFSWQALLWFALGGGLVVVALTDWDTFEISNGLIF